MPLARFSNEHSSCSITAVDNQFFKNYIMDIPDEFVKIYFYGLYVISNHVVGENSVDSFCKKLKIEEKKLLDGFTFLENMGLIEVISASPLEIQYLEIKDAARHRKINPEKYSDFSLQMQRVLSDRMIIPNEFSEYFTFIENNKIEPSALIMIIKYCTDIKGVNVSYKYILTVATDWVQKGLLTVSKVTDELSQRAKLKCDIDKILLALKIKRPVENEDNALYQKWTKEYGFDIGNILFASTLLKSKKNMTSLDKLLYEFFSAKAFCEADMKEIVKSKDDIKNLAVLTVKELGLYYENLDPVITYYIKPWLNMGYTQDGILLLARYCSKKNTRTLERLNDIVQVLFSQGIILDSSIKEHIINISIRDKKLTAILEKAGISCVVNRWHRDNYTTWSETWGLSDELIEHAANLAMGKVNPIAYMNGTLSNFKNKGILTIEEAAVGDIIKGNLHTRIYSDEDLNKLIDDIDSIEI